MSSANKIKLLLLSLSLSFSVYAQDCQLLKKISRMQSNEIESHFKIDSAVITYDQLRHIVSLGPGTTVVSDSKGRVIEVSRTAAGANTEMMVNTKAVYMYNSNDYLTEIQVFGFGETTPRISVRYTYNSSGQLTSAYYLAKIKEALFLTRKIYKYPNATTKNPSVVEIYGGEMSSQPNVIIEYNYDNKRRAFEVIDISEDNPFATSNILNEIHSTENCSTPTKVSRHFTYEYDQSGYPVLKRELVKDNTFTLFYIYNCPSK